MKRVVRNFIIVIILSCCALLWNAKHNYDKVGYSINNFNVEVSVNDKKEYNVTEIIDADFRNEKHGLTRTFGRGISNGDFYITNISVEGVPFTVSRDKKNNLQIKIGDDNESVIGEKKYIIRYTVVNLEKDINDKEVFQFDILGNNWNTDIKEFSGKINFNDNISAANVKANYNKFGGSKNFICDDKKSSSIECTESNNTIFITSKEKIKPKKGIRVSANLGEGFFKNINKGAEGNEVISNTGKYTEEYTLSQYFIDRLKHITAVTFIVIVINIYALFGFIEGLSSIPYVCNYSTAFEEHNEADSSPDSSSGGGSGW